MRWKFPVLVFVLLMITALPFMAAAQEDVPITEPLYFTLSSEDASGPGWSWNAESKTLTLSGINLDVGFKEEGFAVKLPDGAGVILAEGTNNAISNITGSGIVCNGSLNISGGGNISLNSYDDAIYAYDNLTIEMTGNLQIYISSDSSDSYGMGIFVGPFCGPEVSVGSGNLIIRNCNTIDIENGSDVGIWAKGNVSISNCNKFSIYSYYHGIRCNGDIDIASCPDFMITTEHIGIFTLHGNATITNSSLTVHGNESAIATGPVCYSYAIGGDIIINHSFIEASCDADSYAAIFAGDDVPYGGEGEHAKIVLNGCTIAAPAGARVLDVNIIPENGVALSCQSITGLAGINEITDPEQTAKAVTIKPLYTLAYNANGGGSMADASSPYIAGTTVTVLPCAFTAPAHYTFSGWNTAADGSGTSYAPNAAFAIAGDITLYAQYTIDSFTVTFVDWDGSELKKETVAYGDKASAPSPPVKAGYNFTGWDKDFDKVTQDLIVTAQYDINSFTVRFDPQGGSAVAAVTVPYNSIITAPTAPTRKGYTFGGWYKDADCKNAWNFATDKVTADITLYAKWTPSAELPATAGWSAASEVSLAAISLVGGLLMLVLYKRRKKYA